MAFETQAGLQQHPPSQLRVVVHPYASALPLGCFSFAIGNALFAAFLFHLIPASETRLLAVMLLAFVAPLEAAACIMAFLSRDTGAATGLGIFAASWIIQGAQLLLFGSAPAHATGMLLVLLAICLGMLCRITSPGKPLIGILLGLAMCRSVGAAWFEFGGPRPVAVTAAVLGSAIALLAFYCGFAFLLEESRHFLQPFTVRRENAGNALGGSFDDQMSHIANEAGVRQQL